MRHTKWRRPLFIVITAVCLFATATACGTDFSAVPPEAAAREPTPKAEPVVFRVIDVTPAPTSTPVPLDESEFYSREGQRQFPPDLDDAEKKTPLPQSAVIGLWEGYLADSHVIIPAFNLDMHLCEDGEIVPGSDTADVERGGWGLRQSQREWADVVIGREFGRGRLAGITTLSRNGGRTVALDDGIALVSVTDSDRCGE